MQVTQTLAEGLKREFKVVVPAADLATRANAQLEEMKDKVRINGFRPGKVPVAHLRRLYGRSVMADIVNTMVGEANKKIVDDNHIKLAMEPKLDFDGGDDGVKSVLEGTADFAWTVSVEVLPTFEIGDVSGIEIDKPVADVERSRRRQPPRRSRPSQRRLCRQEEGREGRQERPRGRSISPARSTASPSKAAPAPTFRSTSARTPSFPASRTS